MKIVLPAQNVKVDIPEGVDPLWYEKFQQMVTFVNLFSEMEVASLSDGQTFIWDATRRKFLPGDL